ncbi:mediator of RNA polymerase II transcription subunit 15a-like isoform X2 [Cornus florida]|nr:mediator of RNA polymerase II transcription subunit 15a-like isoform X2 [Cornus florida]
MEVGDWRTNFHADGRQRILDKIIETLERHLPAKGQEKLQELKKIAVRFEEKIFTAALSQSDYMRKISMKLMSMETKSQNTMADSVQSNPIGVSNIPQDTASHSMQSQVNNQGQPLSIPTETNQTRACQKILSRNIQNNLGSTGVQGSSSSTSALSPVGIMNQTSIPNVVCQNSNLQNIQNLSGASQNSLGNSMVQGVPSNVFPNYQRQMQRQQVVTEQQQQQSQNQPQYLYQQQLQQRLLKQNFQQQQQQQQNLLQSSQLQASQQSVKQPSVMQTAPLPGLQQNQQSSVQQSTQPVLQPQHPQSVIRQQQQPQQSSFINQHQVSVQQQLMGHQPNATNMQQNQQTGQRNSIPDMQQQQQQRQRLLSQQNKILNLQQQQQQQQLTSQQNDLLNMDHQQLGPQSNVSGLQQQQMFPTQSGNSSMQTNEHSVHMLQQAKVPVHQQTQQSATTLLPTRGNQLQAQPPQQQFMAQIQSQPVKLQQQLGLQQQPTPFQQDMQQRRQTSGPLLQSQNVIDQQNQLFQSQRAVPEPPLSQTGNVNGGDWQEEAYQKIKAMKEMYLRDLNEVDQKLAVRLLQPQKKEQYDRLKVLKTSLERHISLLQVSKTNIPPVSKDKLDSIEKQIISFLNSMLSKHGPAHKQEQLPPSHMHSMQQTQQPRSQVTQLQPLENQMNPQMQSMNLQGSVGTLQQNNATSLQHNSLSSSSADSSAPHNTTNSVQHSSSMDSGQGNAVKSLQQVSVGSLQQNPVGTSQQVTINSLSSHSGNALQLNINPLQSNSNILQSQHLKQQQEQQMLQGQELKQQLQQRQMQKQLMHKQQLLQRQQQWQQTKQQPAQFQTHQMSQLHQMDEVNDLKMRQQMGVKSGLFQQHHPAGQRSADQHQQLMSGASLPVSSPQLLQAASPQIPPHPSPQIDQLNVLTSLTKAGTPVQSANSPFVVPSPSTPLAPFQMPEESEKVNPCVSSLSGAGNIGSQPTTGVLAPSQSLAIGTPGFSASPLLEEFTSPDGHHINASTISGKSSVAEHALELLIKVVKSVSAKTLSASVDDIGSVVSMIDRTAGAAPGNGSRAAIGEDFVATTKCRLLARNFIRQDGTTGTRKMRRYTSAMPLNGAPSTGIMIDGFKQLTGSEVSDLELTATSNVKRRRIEANHALLEEIREINQQLIDTVVDISDEDADPTIAAAAAAAEGGGEGTIVKCSFNAVAISGNLKSQYASSQLSPIRPLRLIVPKNYPNCSPLFLDKFSVEVSKEYEDLSVKAESRFIISLRSLPQPMSLREIARTWDVCARAVISEHAQQSGGGSFSSKYGTWEYCVSAA